MPENAAAPDSTTPDTAAPAQMSFHAAMLGEAGRRLGWLLEGMMTAQVATVLARLAGPVGNQLVRGTPLAGVMPWRVLEFRHV